MNEEWEYELSNCNQHHTGNGKMEQEKYGQSER